MSTDGHNNHVPSVQSLMETVRQQESRAFRRREENRNLKAQVAQLTTDLQAMTTDRDTWKSRVETAPSDVATENERLKGEIRKRDHTSAWKEATANQLHPKVSLDALWREIGYTPGEAVPQPDAIHEQIKKAREDFPYLFTAEGGSPPAGPNGQEKGSEPPSSALRVELESSRGSSGTGGAAHIVKVKKSDLQDPRWALNPANAKMLREAQASGRLEIIDT